MGTTYSVYFRAVGMSFEVARGYASLDKAIRSGKSRMKNHDHADVVVRVDHDGEENPDPVAVAYKEWGRWHRPI